MLAVGNDDFQEEFGYDTEEGFLVLPRPPSSKAPHPPGSKAPCPPSSKAAREGVGSSSTDGDSVSGDNSRLLLEPGTKNDASSSSSSSEGEGGAEGVQSGRAAAKVGLCPV